MKTKVSKAKGKRAVKVKDLPAKKGSRVKGGLSFGESQSGTYARK
jgi:hypothetical protein